MKQQCKRVVIVVNNLNVGGVSTLISQLMKPSSSGKYHYELVNLGSSGDEPLLDQLRSQQIPVHHLQYNYMEGYSVLAYFKKAFFTKKFLEENASVINKLVELKPDILHFHTLPQELLFGQKVAEKINCTLVYTDHTRRIDPTDISFISRSLIQFPFHEFYGSYNIIAVSESVMSYINEFNIDKAAASVKLIVNKIAESNKRISYKNIKELKVVYVARITEGKGHADLLMAWKMLPNLGLHLYLIGPEEVNLKNLVNEREVKNKITFTGSRSDVKEFISDADMGVFPSYKEGLPLALLEKMQLGIPCVVSNIKELTSIVNDNVNGLIYPLGNTEALAACITDLAKHPEKRKLLGMKAAEHINEKYVSKVGGMNMEYEQYYDELLTRK